ncbi:MAG: c-type cytochrome biogenesis protein CcmI [Tabrizicola sp.]|uniref:c-type cytochrome biogenesis protein CcmI n=1 Tax=Tabrizicola sp. TaxID=2005166 RepID=UPI002736C27D|nr:c-type cytochrome biogenesis protein CcmI [Tabrizicola sp.]MDP3265027.1 c-type cytochrome biogenesis protein CcmI [Tabrizicola sp.]MDP3647430.1 c-type cytochrome biogenesis protein CcmI [Paracoccaceae bacterium]MDZ4068088.1 c-type cytochrome biogenesis protein CcmI [Tabrizicola sp.]
MQDWGFWAASVGLFLAVAAILLVALRRDRGLAEATAVDIKVYKDQLAEVERDIARGTLAPDEAQRLRSEVGRRILDADRASDTPQAVSATPALLPAALVLAILAGGIGTYVYLGAPGYPDLPLKARIAAADARMQSRPAQAEAVAAAPKPQAPTGLAPDFLDLMEKLRTAVTDRPNDQRGLELLARNEAALGNYAAAESAQRRLIAVRGDAATANDHASLAEIMIAAAGGYVSPEAEVELVAALSRDPQEPVARYYSGLMFAQSGRYDRAFTLWQPLLQEGPADAPWIARIRAEIEDVAYLAGVNYTLPEASGPNAGDVAAAAEMAPEERQAMIEGMVAQLSDRLATDGGSVEDWNRLIRSLVVLERRDEAQKIYDEAKVRFVSRDAELSFLRLAAVETGLVP